MNKKYIFITEIITILSEKGEEKLSKANSNIEIKDDNGFSLEWYTENNLRPPKDLLENQNSEISEDGYMKLNEDEFTYDFKNRFIDITNFTTAVEADEFGTILEFSDGRDYWIEEDIFEIYDRIHVSQMNRFEKISKFIYQFLGEILRKLKNKNGKKD